MKTSFLTGLILLMPYSPAFAIDNLTEVKSALSNQCFAKIETLAVQEAHKKFKGEALNVDDTASLVGLRLERLQTVYEVKVADESGFTIWTIENRKSDCATAFTIKLKTIEYN